MLLNGDRTVARNAESNLGNWICDAMRNYVTTQTSLLKTYPGTPLVCLTNGGGMRASIPAGNVTQGQIITVSPFGNWCEAHPAAAARRKVAAMATVLAPNLEGETFDVQAHGQAGERISAHGSS